MRFANLRELKLETKKVLQMSQRSGPVIITRKGKPIALLRSIGEEDFGRRVDELWLRVKRVAEESGYGPKDVGRIIQNVRKTKK